MYYLTTVSVFSISILVGLIFYKWYALIFLCSTCFFIHNAWQKYYRLKAKKSIISISIDHNDLMFVTFADGKYCSVKLIDQLHINQLLLLFFVKVNPEKSQIKSIKNSEQKKLILKIMDKARRLPLSIYQECLLFLNYRKSVFIVSEETIGQPVYRNLLRRLSAIKAVD